MDMENYTILRKFKTEIGQKGVSFYFFKQNRLKDRFPFSTPWNSKEESRLNHSSTDKTRKTHWPNSLVAKIYNKFYWYFVSKNKETVFRENSYFTVYN